MTRFFTDTIDPASELLTLTDAQAQHARVLRLRPGETVTVCDGGGTEYLCTVERLTDAELLLRPTEASASLEPSVAVTLYVAFAKGDRLEHVIQKGTELGMAELVVFPVERCVSRPDEKSLPKKLERWQRIAASAAEQSQRGRIPQVRAVGSWAEVLREAAQVDLPVLFYENERARTFRAAIEAGRFRTAALITGPEGGFAEKEVLQAEQMGLRVCTLGSRILRCETAPLCALAALMYAAGEF